MSAARPGFWLAVLALNVAVAACMAALAPAHPVFSDREVYEYVGQHGLAPRCEADIFCPRVLVPVLLEHVPLPSEQRWRLFERLAVICAGFTIAIATAGCVGGRFAPVLATLVAQ